jgi:hypothetical protein
MKTPSQNRSNSWYPAYALIENRGDKLALLSGEIPIYWRRHVAQQKAATANLHSPNWLRVEKVTIHRVDR